ncbi:hypothetical protein [Vreelandella sp. EE7]
MSSDSQSLANNATQELATKPSISTLAQGSMFWQPEYREPSPWLEHLPFLFWLVEALRPTQAVGLGVDLVPHFALCQAVTRLRLGAHCYAIGEANSEQQVRMEEYGAEHFGGTSQWVSVNPTRAIQQFDEASLDLLLLNVASDDDSIDYLLDRWASRLSSKGVVLLPGIAKREPGAQAFRVFNELKSQYPHFAFTHAGGLGVLMVGDTPPALVKNLLGSLESKASSQVVQDIFGRLGRSCQDKVIAQQQQTLANRLQGQVEETQQKLAGAQAIVEEQQEHSHKQDKQTLELQNRITRQEERFAHERGRLAERVSTLEEVNAELKQELARSRHQAEERERLAQQNAETMAQTEKERDQAHQKNEKLQSEYEQQQAELSEALKTLEDNDQAIAQKDRQIANQIQRLEEQETSLRERFEELGQLTRQLNEAETSKQEELAEAKRQNDTLSQQVAELSQSEKQAKEQVNERFEELAVLTNMLEEREAKQHQQVSEHQAELERAAATHKAAQKQANEQKAQLEHKLQEAQKQAEASKVEQKAHLENKLLDAQKIRQQNEAKIDELTNALDEANQEHQRQSNELVALTKRLEFYRQSTLGSESLQEEGPASHSRPVRKTSPLTKRAMKRQVAMIENSRWFDATWYLNQYPDIASDPKMAKQPARHYLVMGGFEGRNPGPEFDSAYYLATHPDVDEGGTNPLIHYLKFGQAEQRSFKASE